MLYNGTMVHYNYDYKISELPAYFPARTLHKMLAKLSLFELSPNQGRRKQSQGSHYYQGNQTTS